MPECRHVITTFPKQGSFCGTRVLQQTFRQKKSMKRKEKKNNLNGKFNEKMDIIDTFVSKIRE